MSFTTMSFRCAKSNNIDTFHGDLYSSSNQSFAGKPVGNIASLLSFWNISKKLIKTTRKKTGWLFSREEIDVCCKYINR